MAPDYWVKSCASIPPWWESRHNEVVNSCCEVGCTDSEHNRSQKDCQCAEFFTFRAASHARTPVPWATIVPGRGFVIRVETLPLTPLFSRSISSSSPSIRRPGLASRPIGASAPSPKLGAFFMPSIGAACTCQFYGGRCVGPSGRRMPVAGTPTRTVRHL